MTDSKHTVYPGYEVTKDGRVFSTQSNWRGYGVRELRQSLNRDGYPSVRLVIDGKRKRKAVHRLVALSYLPFLASERLEVRHLDGNKENNNLSNLAWGTTAENAADRDRHGRTSKGKKHSLAIKNSDHKLKVARGENHYHARAAIAKAEGRS